MPDRQVELFESIAGSALSEFGYPRRFESPSFGARVAAQLGRFGLPIGRLASNRENPSTT
jgi:hypothetical protein